MSIVAKRIRELRERNKYTQAEIAKKLNISLSGYRKIEYGEREPNLDVLREICEIYKVSSDYLLGLKNIPNDIEEQRFQVMMAQLDMLQNKNYYEICKNQEGEDSTTTEYAYQMYMHSKGHYDKVLFNYMESFFSQSNVNPYDDHFLKDKYPFEFRTQVDLLNGCMVSLYFADGYKIEKVKYYTGGFADDSEYAQQKADSFIEKYKKLFRLK